MEYRLAPETPFPGGLNDCEIVIDYLVANAHLYGVDPKKVLTFDSSFIVRSGFR